MEYFYGLVLFFVGASVGSFVNVVVLRHGTGFSSTKSSSQCLFCGKKLRFYELLPVFSYLFLRGKCSSCRSKLSPGYLFAEIASGLLCLASFYKAGGNFGMFVLIFALSQVLLAIFLYDLRHKIIPDSFILAFLVLSFLYSFLNLSIFQSFLASIIVPLPFFLIWLFSSGRYIGLGDVKFMAGMGALLGLSGGVSAVLVSFWAGFAWVVFIMLAGYISKIAGLRQRGKELTMKSELPFAPFLVLGTMLGFFFNINFINEIFKF